jgi:hypothetical protein
MFVILPARFSSAHSQVWPLLADKQCQTAKKDKKNAKESGGVVAAVTRNSALRFSLV